MSLKMAKSMEIPTMDYGEVRVVRPPGGGLASVVAKSKVLAEYLSSVADGKTCEVRWGTHRFQGWVIPDDMYRTLCTPEYSLGGGENFLEDDRFGGLNLAFLRHTALADGIKMELAYPVGLQDYAAKLGKALGALLEDNLFAMDVGYKFWWEEEAQ